MNSNRNSTVSGGFISKQSNGTVEPPPLSRSNVPANSVSLPPYRSNIIILFDVKPVFLLSSSLNRFSLL
ncbi:BnaC05g09080D [Brassica napus]|uniref:BnaC05g09080D protein n=1 Tax=Brassica napus TaxID=3708 RepID=A0A078G1P0_BRANA|nr:BnaC05g09080D [Brassica napus]